MVDHNRDVTKRMNWFDRQFLRAQDLADEQDYQRDRRARHNRLMHTQGVADGLAVTGVAGDKQVTVATGTAIDGVGRELVLLDPVSLPLPDSATAAEVYAVYAELPSDQSTDPTVTSEYTRVAESPDIVFRTIAPTVDPVPASTAPNPIGVPPSGVPGVLLALLALDGQGGLQSAPDNTVQPRAGVTIGDASLSAVTLTVSGQPQSDWPKLSGVRANTVGLSGDLEIPDAQLLRFAGSGQISSLNDLTVATGAPAPSEQLRVTAAGRVGIGTSNPQTVLDVAGDVAASGSLSAEGSLTVNGNASVGGAATVNGALAANGGATVTGSLLTTGPFSAGGTVTVNGGLNVTGDTALKRITLTGPLVPATGNSEAVGVLWPPDPGGGAGDRAFLRYFRETGETTRLRVGIDNDADDRLALYQMGADRLVLYNGQVGILKDAPAFALDVNGTVCGVQFCNPSDLRLKTDVEELDGVVDRLHSVRSVRFHRVGQPEDSRQLGVLAQEVENAFPELVLDDSDGYKSVDYMGLAGVLVQAVRELNERNRELANRVEELERSPVPPPAPEEEPS